MNALDSQIGRYKLTVRLFYLISELPRDKQYILYKQLIKGSVLTEILKLIIDMDDNQKFQLLEQLEEFPNEDEPVRTLDLDENESFMRENARKVCKIPVKCTIEDRSFKSYIIDIGTVGALIQSNDRFPIGQQVLMVLELPNHDGALELKSRIVRTGLKGIAVKYYDLKQIHEDLIRFYINTSQ
jgi:hypothetical protein